MRSFEFADGTSAKFWEIDQTGTEVTVRWGRTGTAGQTKVKVPCAVDNSYGYQLFAPHTPLPPSPFRSLTLAPQQCHQRYQRLYHLRPDRQVLRRRCPVRRLDAAPRAAHLRRAGRRHGYRHRYGEQAHLSPSFRPHHLSPHHHHRRRSYCLSWKMSLHDRLGHRRLRQPRDADADAARAEADPGAGLGTEREGGRGGDEDGVLDCVSGLVRGGRLQGLVGGRLGCFGGVGRGRE